jgi:hypothetical protein
MDSFIDAKSMLTPGVAGTIVMLVTNALANNFSLPGRWVALVLSFVCGLLVFGDRKLKVGPRIAFYVLNSLIVFATAVGANGIGAAASSEPAPPAPTVAEATATPVPAAVTAAPATTPAAVPTAASATPATPQKTFFRPWLARAAAVRAQ